MKTPIIVTKDIGNGNNSNMKMLMSKDILWRNRRRIIFYDATSRSTIWTDFRLDRRYHVRISSIT